MTSDRRTDPAFPDSRHVLEAGCDRCPALAAARECISWGTGSLEASIVVVGEAPGAGTPDAERWQGGNWTGKAYTSRHSGRRIRRLLADLGYDDVYFTNAVKCFPASEAQRASSGSGETASEAQRASSGSGEAASEAQRASSGSGEAATADSTDSPTNREPTPEERTNCRGHLLTEIETVDPDVVLATGKHATATVLAAEGRDLDGFLETVLEPIACRELGAWLLPVVHPSYQDVWISRLGYDADSYQEAIGDAIAACRDDPIERDR